jgi:5-methyltetrahydrofolate--homocysteine methyltransferase
MDACPSYLDPLRYFQETTEAKVRMAVDLAQKVEKAGIPLADFYIDALVYPVATNSLSAVATLDAIAAIVKELPGVHTTCGLTNVSFGLPKRKLVNRTFLVAAITRGLDSAIMDPTDNELFGALKAALLITGKDEYCMDYISAFRKGRLG